MIATIDEDRTVESACESAYIRVNPRWSAKSAFHINNVRTGPQSSGNAPWLARGDHDVVVIGDRQRIENRLILGGFNQCQVTPEIVEVGSAAISGCGIRDFNVLAGE